MLKIHVFGKQINIWSLCRLTLIKSCQVVFIFTSWHQDILEQWILTDIFIVGIIIQAPDTELHMQTF